MVGRASVEEPRTGCDHKNPQARTDLEFRTHGNLLRDIEWPWPVGLVGADALFEGGHDRAIAEHLNRECYLPFAERSRIKRLIVAAFVSKTEPGRSAGDGPAG